MMKSKTLLPLGALLLAAPLAFGQAAKTPAAAPKGAHAKSKAEQTDLNALTKLSQDPATQGPQLDAAITSFVTKYPTSDFLGTVNTYGLEWNQTEPHKNYEKSLFYAEAAIKADPNSIAALSAAGDVIPDHVQDSDLDRDQRLKEATDDDNAVLNLVATAGDKLNGQPFTQGEKNYAAAVAYTSLARIANLNQDYAGAIKNYKLAIPLEADATHKAMDEFYEANAQIQAKQYTDALATLDACDKDAAGIPQITQAVAHNRQVIAALQKQGH